MTRAVDGKLATLAARFRERALADRAALSAIAVHLEREDGAAQAVEQIAHRLAGAGGTFGYPGISARAAELEELAASGPNGQGLAEGCQALMHEIDRAVAGAE